MKRSTLGMILAVVVIGSLGALADIPEPDTVLYGQVFVDGVLWTNANTDVVEIIARVDGVTNPVGTYTMGSVGNVGDKYVLRLRLEWLAAGETQSDDAALIGQTVHIFIIKEKGGVEEHAKDFIVPGRGHAEAVLLHTPANGDANGDDVVGLTDYQSFFACMSGPNASATPSCQSVFDFDSNSTVDFRDFSGFQTAFSGK